MNDPELELPSRPAKPRAYGMTILIDNGLPLNLFKDTINSAAPYIDLVKFGWGTSIISNHINEKINHLRTHETDFFFGGTLFEKFLSQGKIPLFFDYCRRYECNYVEISNGTLPLSNHEKARYISAFSKEFKVLSEVGSKDVNRSMGEDSHQWLEHIQEDLDAGVFKVLTEAREGGTSGICNGNGDIRSDLVEGILRSDLHLDSLIFEAPNKKLQTFFIQKLGPNVNLANIPFSDALSLETLRLGLRADTFFIGGNKK
ncbi:phosphosulfolactate synthase [Heyndrickxia acidiproducens]|uniref:phosphosulfolactate synthase n=1 Tax=Heyndrickxia acidiproducens TaxID=1121084 RepID=UPI0003671ABC|nr:phosphosulfolactate synthase [Heyndrickxia acidiproducens]